MRSALLLASVAFLTSLSHASAPTTWQTRAEASRYKETSLYRDVLAFISQTMKQAPDIIRLSTLTRSTEGRPIPLVIVSRDGISRPEDHRRSGRSCILVQANIHAGEVEGKEAVLMLLRELAQGEHRAWLEEMNILFLPLFNPDGNEQLGHNRRDNGPELAGVRHNGQHLDLNRDYLKSESPEVSAELELLKTWDPILFIDLHTTNGSLHQEPVTFSTHSHPATDPRMVRFMWEDFFPAVQTDLEKKHRTRSVPYGNFINRAVPEAGWFSDAAEGRYGTNYIGLRNRFSILSESYSHADFSTRVLTTRAFVSSILDQCMGRLARMHELARMADGMDLRQSPFPLTWTWDTLLHFDLESFLFTSRPMTEEERKSYPSWYGTVLVESTGKPKTYHLPYQAKPIPQTTRPCPQAYVLLPGHPETESLLLRHGCTLLQLSDRVQIEGSRLDMSHIKPTDQMFQGHVLMEISGSWSHQTLSLPPRSILLPMNGPLARILPVLMEPESDDSLARWGFFNRTLIQQWTNRPDIYPVLRIESEDVLNTLLSCSTVFLNETGITQEK